MPGSETNGRYVIITPARNEGAFIERTIHSVLGQTIRPLRWVIVNDGSTDGTQHIVESFLKEYRFIQLINLRRKGGRNFGGKAIAFRQGASAIESLDYDFIGNLDADISIGADYYRKAIQHFTADPDLGIAGGAVFHKIGESISSMDKTMDSVGGAVQLFRRSCFEAVGGYPSLELGGIDAAAEIKAKMLGWKVRKFPDLEVIEHRGTGCAEVRGLQARLREGRRFYSLGYAPFFYFIRCLYRTKERPFLLGSIAALYGFLESSLMNRPIVLPADVVAYLRGEQRKRLRQLLKRFPE